MVDYTARMPSPAVPMIDPATGIMTPAWFRWFLAIFSRTGDAMGVGVADLVKKAGDTMTGPLILSGDPTSSLAAATKHYVDSTGIGPATYVWPVGVANVSNGTYEIVLSWPRGATAISSIVTSCIYGSFTAAIQINGASVAGLGGVAVAGSIPKTTIAGTNSLVNGNNLTLLVSAAAGSTADFSTDFYGPDFGSALYAAAPTGAAVQVNFTRSTT